VVNLDHTTRREKGGRALFPLSEGEEKKGDGAFTKVGEEKVWESIPAERSAIVCVTFPEEKKKKKRGRFCVWARGWPRKRHGAAKRRTFAGKGAFSLTRKGGRHRRTGGKHKKRQKTTLGGPIRTFRPKNGGDPSVLKKEEEKKGKRAWGCSG